MAKVHSERSDHKGNRLEKRFGHPSLHADLFTPMLHAKMMPLLSQVYAGSISQDKVKLDEYRGQQMSAQVVPGGIRIAAIDQVCISSLMMIVRGTQTSKSAKPGVRSRHVPTRPWRTGLGCQVYGVDQRVWRRRVVASFEIWFLCAWWARGRLHPCALDARHVSRCLRPVHEWWGKLGDRAEANGHARTPSSIPPCNLPFQHRSSGGVEPHPVDHVYPHFHVPAATCGQPR